MWRNNLPNGGIPTRGKSRFINSCLPGQDLSVSVAVASNMQFIYKQAIEIRHE
jgi:hypothetical protein